MPPRDFSCAICIGATGWVRVLSAGHGDGGILVGMSRKNRNLLIALGLFVTVYGVYRVVNHIRVQNRIAAIRAAGEPTTIEELANWPVAIPDGQPNAADLYAEALALYVQPADEKLPILRRGDMPELGQRFDPATREALTEALADNTQALALYRQAVTIPHCRFAYDYSELPFYSNDGVHAVFQGKRLIQVIAALAFEDGDTAAGLDAVQMLLKMAAATSGHPDGMTFIVTLGCRSAAVNTLEVALNLNPFDDHQLQRCAAAISPIDAPDALANVAIGERCVAVIFHDYVRHHNTMLVAGREVPIWFWRLAGLNDLYAVGALDYMNAHLAAVRRPYAERSFALRELADESLKGFISFYFVFEGNYAHWNDLELNWFAERSACLASMAIERYRLAHGTLPDSLDALVPTYLEAVPADPFAEAPMRYVKREVGYVVYSVGRNEVDDGGSREVSRYPRHGGPLDIVFEVRR